MPAHARPEGPTAAFTVAEAAAHGLTPSALRSKTWSAPTTASRPVATRRTENAGPHSSARVDLLYRFARQIIEYDGDHHRDPDQWSRDRVRRAELEPLGYRTTIVTRRDFDDPTMLSARIRRLLAASA
ncbi:MULTISPECIES: hypothetical protein [unclassified Microbacterium]|uniref:hypothetical protein n=1 Tax=unclassified Microbacterium TaxID=2609290 RepID=UPI0009772CD6|nr:MULTISPECIES: hypothetical protein [unclassified Microbacterium]